MTTKTIFRERHLLIEDTTNVLEHGLDWVQPSFVALVFAYDPSSLIEPQIIKDLAWHGCAEFCCLGPLGEILHDLIDDILVDEDLLSVLTTRFGDFNEGIEYVINIACLGKPNLMILIPNNPLVEDLALACVHILCDRDDIE